MGSLDKQVFKGFVDTECPRKLFLSLGRDDPRWISPATEIIPRQFEHDQEGVMDLGKAYEASVYKALCVHGSVKHASSPKGDVVPKTLSPALLESYAREVREGAGRICLIEHQFAVPETFARRVFGLPDDKPIPLLDDLHGMRPDLLLLERPDPKGLRELLPGGSVRAIGAGDERVALRVVDIKHTAEMRVGKSHFIEILYYAHALASFLELHGLHEHVYIPTTGHGILPQHDVTELFAMTVSNIDKYIVDMRWTDVSHLFTSVQRQVRSLLSRAPMPVESVPVNIQASCGHCKFVDDCKSRLGFREGVIPSEWDVRLLPHTTDALCQQLNREGFLTIGDVAERISTYQTSDTPEPLYAEKPLLALKAKAIVEGTPLEASEQNTGGSRQLSMAIPKLSEIELVLDAETDPTNDVVFAVGFVLSCTVNDQAPFYEVNRRWWEAWDRQLRQHRRAEQVAIDTIVETLDPEYVAHAFPNEKRRRLEQLVRSFAESLWALRSAAGSTLVVGKREDSDRVGMRYEFGYVNGGTELADERKLASVLVERAYHVVVIASALEVLLCAFRTDRRGQREPVGPRFAGFYWSSEQLQHIQDLLERHLEVLIHHNKLRGPLLRLLNWLSPTESEVDPSLQHKKIFNLRTFVETSVGLPHIINYTWHGLAGEAFDCEIDQRFWAPHFNYMDFAVWHAFVNERDTGERNLLFQGIAEQLLFKIQSVHQLLRRYRRVAWETISDSSWEPVSSQDLLQSAPPDTLHPLARVWYLFAKLNGAVQMFEADHGRITFPAQTIGKLKGGEVSALAVSSRGVFRFELRGLSSNMKVREGDWCWLLPEGARDRGGWALNRHMVEILSLRWQSSTSAYLVEATAQREDSHPLDTEAIRDGESWYLYPSASDRWSGRLFGSQGSLFGRQNMGSSWLGRRLSYLWGIGSDEGIPQPRVASFGLPEIYLYAPQLLPQGHFDPEAPLLTDAHAPPDPSQRHAIHLALASTLCCLQGPPGTGKSQTIAALVDEFLHRRQGQRTRILVTAFSYAALNVVLEKVLDSRNAKGEPTKAARLQAICARSSSRDKSLSVQQGRARDLVVGRKKLVLDDQPLNRKGGKRLEDFLEESFILFANAHQLYYLGEPSESSRNAYELLRDGFGFDLIIVDEASQMPADYFLTAAALVRPRAVQLALDPEPTWPARSREDLEPLRSTSALASGELTKVVIVGDDRQLPPVQAVKPPRKLRVALDSLFRYYTDGHKVPRYQLRINYRSEPPIVAYTRLLDIYEELHAFREQNPYTPLPEVPPTVTHPWLRWVLSPGMAVGAIVHTRRFETAVSPLEAQLVARMAVAFFEQMCVTSPDEERAFWREHLGIVSPHNAHGRLVARRIFEALTVGIRRTHLPDDELMGCLDATIYSVEKFQGSDRTFILATVGVSSLDQLRAEEEFIYDLNRFNVLTSRARQKMLLVCSQNLLDYVPRDREIMANAARIRAYAMEFCDRDEAFTVQDETGHESELQLRWHGSVAVDAPTTPPPMRPPPRPIPPPVPPQLVLPVTAAPAPASPPPPATSRSARSLSRGEVVGALGSGLRSLLAAPSPGVRRDEVILIACQQLGLSPLDDDALRVLGAALDDLLLSSRRAAIPKRTEPAPATHTEPRVSETERTGGGDPAAGVLPTPATPSPEPDSLTASRLPLPINLSELESHLWEAANILRGSPVDRTDWKSYILPLLFYKRICDVWDEEHAAMLAEYGEDFPDEHRFQVPEGAHWKDVRGTAKNVGTALANAMREVEVANQKHLYGVFGDAQWTNKDRLPDELLKDLIEHFSALSLGNQRVNSDIIGDAYEYLIKQFADATNKKAGEFYTPRSVVRLMIDILDPKEGETVYDPACGTGGMLLAAIEHVREKGGDPRTFFGKLFGQEKNLTTAAVAKMNLLLHGLEDFAIERGDTLRAPVFRDPSTSGLATFDVVLANPPFSLEQWGREEWESDPWGRAFAGLPKESNADMAWVQHMVKSMAPGTGRMAVVLPQGALFRGGVEAQIRKHLLEKDLVEAAIGLAPNLFYGTGLAACVLVLRQAKSETHKGKVLIVDASAVFRKGRAQNFLEPAHCAEILGWVQGFVEVEDRARAVSLAEIEKEGWTLNISRYVLPPIGADIPPLPEAVAAFKDALAKCREAEEHLRKVMTEGGWLS